MALAACRRCGKQFDLGEPICPFCFVPRIEPVEDEAPPKAPKGKSKAVGGWIAAAVIVAAGWILREPLTAPVRAALIEFSAEVEKARTPGRVEPVQLIHVPKPPVPISSAPLPPAPAPPVLVAGPAPVPESEMRARGVRVWYGVVYDLVTLRPVVGARLVFKMEGSETVFTTTTDNSGHYQIRLESSTDNQLTVMIRDTPGYRDGLLEDRDPPLRDSARAVRLSVAEETHESNLEPVPLRCREGAEVVNLDLVLLPSGRQ